MIVKVRDDDVLLLGKGYEDVLSSFEKFKIIHELIKSYKAVHVPALICSSIKDDYIIDYLRNNDVELQLHGWEHVNYGNFTRDEMANNFKRCHNWFMDTFGILPTIFYPPWNGWNLEIESISKEFGMEVRGCNVEKIEPWYISNNIDKYKGRDKIEILMHWWWGKRKLERAFEALRSVGDV